MSKVVFSSEIKDIDDMREEAREMFEYLQGVVSIIGGSTEICPICKKEMDQDNDDLDVFDMWLDYHLWGEHNWIEVGRWIYENLEAKRTSIKKHLDWMKKTLGVNDDE